jgi:PAS domain S-box-containing protein
MSTVTVLWSIVAGSCFALAIVQCMVWWARRAALAHAVLSIAAAGTGAMALCELWLMKASSPAAFATALRWAHVPVTLLVLTIMAYVLIHLRTGRLWLAVSAGTLRVLDLGLNVVLPGGARFREFEALRPLEFLGDTVMVPEGTPNPWMLFGQLSTLLFVAFLVDAAVMAWRRDAPRRDVLIAAAFVLPAVVGFGQAAASFQLGLPTPITLSIFFLPVLLVVTHERSLDVVRAATLEPELRDSEARLRLAAQAGGVCVWVSHPDEGEVQGSGEWCRLFGLPEQTRIPAAQMMERVHADDRERVAEAWTRSLTGLEDFDVEFRLTLPDDTERWVYTRGRMFPDHAGGGEMFGAALDVTARKKMEAELREALAEVEGMRDQLLLDNLALRDEVQRRPGEARAIVGESEPIRRMLALAERVAPTDSGVLITGETGTGKELLAHAIHDMSARRDHPMIKVNCAALPSALIESELFGREKGAYTGAMTRQAGRFELADRSTIFLDEIGELPLELQAKLLRVLQDGQFERLGSTRTLKTDARVIAATNRDLAARVAEGTFREDLYHRLNVFPIHVPALRDRPEDIPLLAWTFVNHFNHKMGKSVDQISRAAWDLLKRHPWPGNVREMKNQIERAMILSEGRSLRFAHPASGPNVRPEPLTLQDIEERHILTVLDRTGWKISGDSGAAKLLGMPPTTLHSRMKKLGIERPARTS